MNLLFRYNKMLEKLYSNLNNPSSLSSINKLYLEAKKHGYRNSDVKSFLSEQDSYTLMKQTNNKFKRRQFLFQHPGHTLVADVAYVLDYKKSNCGVGYLLFLLDGFSRYLSVIPLKTLKSNEVSIKLEKYLQDNIYNYKKIFSDCGQELTNNKIKNVYKKHNIEWYTTFNKDIKAGLVERVIKTIKIKISKYIIHFNTEKYIDILQDIISTYNKTPHTSLLGRTPIDVYLMNDKNKIRSFAQSLYKSHAMKTKPVSDQLAIGQAVRLKATRFIFKRAYHYQNTLEIFKITNIIDEFIPITYKIKDLQNKDIEGSFYREELIPVIDKGVYSITILKTRYKKKKKEHLVTYINYPHSEPVWIMEKDLV